MLFYFFMSDDLSFINTTQKTFKPSKKIVSMPRMDEKKLHTWEFQLKRSSRSIWDASCFKKGLLEKQQNVPNTCTILPLKKIFYQNLTDAFCCQKFHFFLIKQQFSSNHPMQPSFVAAVISVVSYFKFQVLCTRMSC